MQFGYSREPITRSLRVDICDGTDTEPFVECRLPTEGNTSSTTTRPEIVSAGLQSDLIASDGNLQFPASQFTITASNVGRSGVLINVNANPNSPEAVHDGKYSGRVVIDRADLSPIELTLTVTLAPRTGKVAWLVVASLSLGAAGGALIKWLNESFTPLAALRRRQRRLDAFLEGYDSDLPEGVQKRLEQVRQAIRTFDSESIGTTIDDITKNQDALLSFARGVQFLAQQLDEQRALFATGGTPDARTAMQLEVFELNQLASQVWPWEQAKDVTAALSKAQSYSRYLTAAMQRYAGSRTRADEALVNRIAQKMVEEDSKDMFPADWQQSDAESVDGQGVGSDATGSVEVYNPAAPPVSLPQWLNRGHDANAVVASTRTVGEWLLDNAWWITLVVVAMAVIFVGYETQFVDDPSFKGIPANYLGFAAWALAIQVAGGTVIETVGKLRASKAEL